ncbi:MAG: hypothetical protein ACRD1X_01855 [Vicinamibacteria bacterium]
MVIVRINQWEEFLEELEEHQPPDKIVRLTFSVRYDKREVHYLTMVAGFLEGATIVEFVEYLGRRPDPQSKLSGEIQNLFFDRKRQLERLGYTVKSGRYHAPLNLTR